MDFNSTIFLFLFFPISITLYYLSPSKVKKVTLLFMSLVFSIWMSPRFFLILAFTIAVDFWISRKIVQSKHKKYWLYFSMILNIGLLLYFKYVNFFIFELNRVFSLGVLWTQTLLPLGISFFTFKKISYIVDIYRGAVTTGSFADYALYVLFFPQLPAGPIARYREFYSKPGLETVFNGCYRLSLGLFKKFLLADSAAVIADSVFALPASNLTTTTALLGVFSYTIQIFFDFSGYTDMAVGISNIFGYNSPENFNMPYTSKSITEFWRRWHMTLSGFFRDYVYIPLGGSRCSGLRNHINLWIVFALTGFWHGASWTFILWGLYYAVLLTLERMLKIESWKIPAILKQGVTFVLVMLGWAIFRADGLRSLLHIFKAMIGLSTSQYEPYLPGVNEYTLTLLFLSFILSISNTARLGEFLRENVYAKGFAATICVAFAIIKFSAANFTPFIYFKF